MIKKLGIKAGYRICFLGDPPHYRELLGELPEDVEVEERPIEAMDFIHYFALEEGLLAVEFPGLKEALAPAGMIWISWPKKTSKIDSGLKFDRVQKIGLLNGLVDCKVCAVDDDWSAVKFMYRKKDR